MKTQNTTEEVQDDKLADLFTDAENASKNSALIAGIKDEEIREMFASLISAKCSDGATRHLIISLAKYDVDKLDKLIQVLPLSNSSALRQSLAAGFNLPSASRAAPAPLGF